MPFRIGSSWKSIEVSLTSIFIRKVFSGAHCVSFLAFTLLLSSVLITILGSRSLLITVATCFYLQTAAEFFSSSSLVSVLCVLYFQERISRIEALVLWMMFLSFFVSTQTSEVYQDQMERYVSSHLVRTIDQLITRRWII